MKKYALIILVVASVSSSFGQIYSAGDPTSITGYGNYHPQIEISNDNAPIVLWSDISSKNVYFAKFNGTDFNTPIQINPIDFDAQVYNWSGPDLCTWQDDIYITFRSTGYETGHIYIVKSEDNGSTFGDTVRVDNLTQGFGQYPDVAVHNDTVYVTFMDHNSTGMDPQYVVSRSIDGGLTFEPKVVAGVILGNEACDCCQPEIVVNDKHVVVFFRNNANNIRDIKAVISYDRGATFTNWISVDDHQWQIMSCPSTGPDARLTDTQNLLSTYKTEVNGGPKVFINDYSLSTNTSLSTIELSSLICPSSNYPQIESSGNNIGIVWEGYANSTDVFFNATRNGISSLDTNNILNLTDQMGVQSKPDISYFNGSYYIVYSDLSKISLIEVSEALSIMDAPKSESLIIYPNPVKDKLSIKLSATNEEKILVTLFDMNGKIVYKNFSNSNGGESFEIDISKIPAGLYSIKVSGAESSAKGAITKL